MHGDTSNMDEKTFAIFDSPLNKRIINDLNERGQNVIIFQHFNKIKLDLRDFKLENQDWLIFTDVNTVDLFVESLTEIGVSLFELDELRVCAFGETVSDKLRIYQLHADVIPAKLDSDSVIFAIKEYEYEFDSKRFLILNREDPANEIVKAFQKENATFEVRSLYKFERSTISPKSKALLKGGAIDEFIINSTEDICNFVELTNDKEIVVAATDSIIFQSLKENGLNAKFFQTAS
jgi:uroporphyrinogen-III synthase